MFHHRHINFFMDADQTRDLAPTPTLPGEVRGEERDGGGGGGGNEIIVQEREHEPGAFRRTEKGDGNSNSEGGSGVGERWERE